ncbi:MAG TPA: CBS domain-containing protein [Bdellovibrionales bacterium]|nr:CBS domain-containing protein [Bdellovibrionales bacterium]
MSTRAEQQMSRDLEMAHFMDGLPFAYGKLLKKKVRHLPVIDDSGAVVGIISERDFQKAMWPAERPSSPGGIRDDFPEFRSGAVVGDYMSTPVKAVDHDTPLTTAARMMIEQKISAVIVIENSRMTGILTTEDMLRVLVSLLEPAPTLKDRVMGWAQSTPIGKVATSLAEVGI